MPYSTAVDFSILDDEGITFFLIVTTLTQRHNVISQKNRNVIIFVAEHSNLTAYVMSPLS